MSSLLKKKGAASFKPRAPARRPGAPAPPSASPPVPSIRRLSQTPSLLSIDNAPLPPVEAEALTETETELTTLLEKSAAPTSPTRQESEVILQPSIHQAQQQLPPSPLGEIVTLPSPPTTRRPASQASLEESHEIVTTSIASSPPLPLLPTTSTESPLLTVLNREYSPELATERPAGTSAQEISLQDTLTTSATSSDGQQINREHGGQNNDTITTHTRDETVDLSIMGAGEADHPSQVVPVVPLNVDGTSGTPVPIQPATTRPRARKRTIDEAGIDVRPSVEVQVQNTRARRTSIATRKPRKPRAAGSSAPRARKKRAETPEDAEDQEIDHSTIKMADLCKDLKIGKKFSKHDEIKQRDIDKKAKAKLRRENPELVGGSDDERPTTTRSETETPVQNSSVGPRMRLVDGQIVIDESSLNLDRHKLAAANAGVMEIVEENEFTRITTSGTFMKREKNIFWDMEAEQKFYTGLRMFGTDFEMISNMFPDRNRRQIKLKFNKEERLYPSKINSALLGEKMPIDFEEYKSHTGLEYEDVAVINAEREEIEAEQNAEEARVEAELAEATRQKKAAIHATRGPEGKENDGYGGGSNTARSKKKGKQKNKASVFGGGEDVEVLGEI